MTRRTAEQSRSSPPAPGDGPGGAPEDRWAWRRRIRADPHRRRVYRVLVGVVGGLLVLLSLLTGWLPGPGGIPLFLLGLAVLASEFAWAHRLLHRAREETRKFTHWAASRPRWVRVLGSVATLALAVCVGWLYLVVLGAPTILPSAWTDALTRVPGVGR